VAINTNVSTLSQDAFAAYGEEAIKAVLSKVGMTTSGDSEENKIPVMTVLHQ